MMRHKILGTMARTYFVCAWIDAVEGAETRAELSDLHRRATGYRPPRSWDVAEIRRYLSAGQGEDWFNAAPATDKAAHKQARTLARAIEAANGIGLDATIGIGIEAVCTR